MSAEVISPPKNNYNLPPVRAFPLQKNKDVIILRMRRILQARKTDDILHFHQKRCPSGKRAWNITE